jgi:4-carboxymuconolactone decarboxylase
LTGGNHQEEFDVAQSPRDGVRFAPIALDDMTPDQRKIADRVISGPRQGLRGPYNALLRSPDLADRSERVGEYIRYKNSYSEPLKELAIIITARHWTAQYEWYAHRKFAEQQGISAAICDAIAAGKRPSGMTAEQAAVYDFCIELLQKGQVSDPTYAAIHDRFGERGVVDLIYTVGHYSTVAMILNVDRYPVPEGTKLLD